MAQLSDPTNRQSSFNEQFARQQSFEKQIANRLRLWTVYKSYRPATLYEDMKMSFDLVLVLGNKELRVGARLRDWEYRHFNDFTIRSSVPSGVTTELDKLKQGTMPDLYFYGYISPHDRIIDFAIIDMHSLISSGLLKKQYQQKQNKDDTAFIPIKFDDMLKEKQIAMIYHTSKTYVIKRKNQSAKTLYRLATP